MTFNYPNSSNTFLCDKLCKIYIVVYLEIKKILGCAVHGALSQIPAFIANVANSMTDGRTNI